MAFDDQRGVRQDEDGLLAALVALHRQKQAPQRRPGTNSGRIIEHFERRGQRLHGERLVTSELVDSLVNGARALPTAPVQQELRIVGPAGGVAAGRFRVTNRSSERAGFELVVGPPLDGGAALPTTFEPQRGVLDAGGTLLVRVETRVGGAGGGAPRTLPVECRWRGGADRLWLVVSALPDVDAAGPRR